MNTDISTCTYSWRPCLSPCKVLCSFSFGIILTVEVERGVAPYKICTTEQWNSANNASLFCTYCKNTVLQYVIVSVTFCISGLQPHPHFPRPQISILHQMPLDFSPCFPDAATPICPAITFFPSNKLPRQSPHLHQPLTTYTGSIVPLPDRQSCLCALCLCFLASVFYILFFETWNLTFVTYLCLICWILDYLPLGFVCSLDCLPGFLACLVTL